MSDVRLMPATGRMTPEQALGHASLREWQDVIVMGYDEGGVFTLVSSKMAREQAAWLAQLLIRHALEAE